MKQEEVTLYYREGSSNKVYRAELKQKGAGWVVHFAYGRRGSTMSTGTKTSAPTEFEKAKKIYDKLVAEKTGKGYTAGEDGAVYVGTSSEARDTGVRCQLLNDVDEAAVAHLLADDEFGAQEKFDGRRLIARKAGAEATGINRKGLTVALAAAVAEGISGIDGSVAIDGEGMGDTLQAFDLLELNGDLRGKPYIHRYKLLKALSLGAGVRVVPLAIGFAAKKALLERVRAERGEGVVFKRLDAPYKAGRPNSGGDQLKHKFYATGSFVVSKVNAKRSVALEVLHGGKPYPIGNVTIPPNKAVPAAGAIVEVRYLYCFPGGGSLYQPTYLNQRDDIELDECTSKQLKFRAEGGEDDA